MIVKRFRMLIAGGMCLTAGIWNCVAGSDSSGVSPAVPSRATLQLTQVSGTTGVSPVVLQRHPARTNQVISLVGLPDSVISWDSVNKELTVPDGTPEAKFDFNLTNVSLETVVVSNAESSCYCTVAKLPSQPWILGPGAGGQIHVTMDLTDKSGRLSKLITVTTDHGVRMLLVNATILPAPAQPVVPMGDREKNQARAKGDRQAVLRGECATCHVEPGRNKFGKDLYLSVCGVCHEAERRATMVPNLHTIAQPTNAEFWRHWITSGKAGTLMPAFGLSQGGFLGEPQIASLVSYLTATMPARPAAGPATNSVPAPH